MRRHCINRRMVYIIFFGVMSAPILQEIQNNMDVIEEAVKKDGRAGRKKARKIAHPIPVAENVEFRKELPVAARDLIAASGLSIGEYAQLHNMKRQTVAQWNTGKCSASKSGGVSAPAWDTLFALWAWDSFHFAEGEVYDKDIETVAAGCGKDIFSIGFRQLLPFTFDELVKASGLSQAKYAEEHNISLSTIEKWISGKLYQIGWDSLFSLWVWDSARYAKDGAGKGIYLNLPKLKKQ